MSCNLKIILSIFLVCFQLISSEEHDELYKKFKDIEGFSTGLIGTINALGSLNIKVSYKSEQNSGLLNYFNFDSFDTHKLSTLKGSLIEKYKGQPGKLALATSLTENSFSKFFSLAKRMITMPFHGWFLDFYDRKHGDFTEFNNFSDGKRFMELYYFINSLFDAENFDNLNQFKQKYKKLFNESKFFASCLENEKTASYTKIANELLDNIEFIIESPGACVDKITLPPFEASVHTYESYVVECIKSLGSEHVPGIYYYSFLPKNQINELYRQIKANIKNSVHEDFFISNVLFENDYGLILALGAYRILALSLFFPDLDETWPTIVTQFSSHFTNSKRIDCFLKYAYDFDLNFPKNAMIDTAFSCLGTHDPEELKTTLNNHIQDFPNDIRNEWYTKTIKKLNSIKVKSDPQEENPWNNYKKELLDIFSIPTRNQYSLSKFSCDETFITAVYEHIHKFYKGFCSDIFNFEKMDPELKNYFLKMRKFFKHPQDSLVAHPDITKDVQFYAALEEISKNDFTYLQELIKDTKREVQFADWLFQEPILFIYYATLNMLEEVFTKSNEEDLCFKIEFKTLQTIAAGLSECYKSTIINPLDPCSMWLNRASLQNSGFYIAYQEYHDIPLMVKTNLPLLLCIRAQQLEVNRNKLSHAFFLLLQLTECYVRVKNHIDEHY